MKRFNLIGDTCKVSLRVTALVLLLWLPLQAAITVAGSSDFIVTNNYLTQIANCDAGFLIVYCEFKTTSNGNDGLIGSGSTNSYADFEVVVNVNENTGTEANCIYCMIGLKGSSGKRFAIDVPSGTLYDGAWHSIFIAASDDSLYWEYDNESVTPIVNGDWDISTLTMHDDALIGWANTGGSFIGSIDDVFFGYAPNGTDLRALAAAISLGIWPSFAGISDVMYFDFIDLTPGTVADGTGVRNWSATASTSSGDGVTATTDGEWK